MLGAFPAVHISCQDSVFDERYVCRFCSLVINIYRQRTGFPESGMCKIRQRYQIAGDPFVQVMGCHAAAQDQVGLHRMPHSFMGQHTCHHAIQYDGFFARVGIHALPFLYKLVIQSVDTVMQCGSVPEVQVKGSLPSESLEQFHRRARFRHDCKHDIDIGPRSQDMCVCSVRDHQQFLHGVLCCNHSPADQIRVFLFNIGVHFMRDIHIHLLGRIMNVRLCRQLPCIQWRQRRLACAGMPVHKRGIFRGGFKYGFCRLLRILRHGGKAVYAAAVYPC